MFPLYDGLVGRVTRGRRATMRRPAPDTVTGRALVGSALEDRPTSVGPAEEEIRPRWTEAFAGPPGHQPIAWVGTLAGVGLLAATLVVAVIGAATPLLLLALLTIGVAEGGWAVELLPRGWVVLARWGRLARWACALAGLGLAGLSLVRDGASHREGGAIVAFTGVLLALEMAPRRRGTPTSPT
jgi:hypothetical protein